MNDIFDTQTKRWIGVELAYKRGFPSARFRPRPNTHVFAYPDKRKVGGFRRVAYTDKTEVANARRSKAQQIYPAGPPAIYRAQLPLAPVIAQKNWQYLPFNLPFTLATLANAGERNAANEQNPDRQIAEIQFMSGTNIIHSDPVDFRGYATVGDWWESQENTGFLRYNTSSRVRQTYRIHIESSDSLRIIFYRNMVPAIFPVTYGQQVFLDSVDEHCMLGEIQRYFEELTAEAVSPKTAQNRRRFIEKTKEMLVKYAAGIPESDLEAVAKYLDVAIVTEDPMFNVIKSYNPKARNKRFRYIFSRMNHGDYVTASLSQTPELVSQEEAKAILDETLSLRKWNKYIGTISVPSVVVTTTKTYQVETPLSKIMKDFGKTFDWGMKINAVAKPELAKFLKAGAKIMINWRHNSRVPTDEIDMIKAYTQFKHAPFYIGFPSIISNVGKVEKSHDVRAHPGVYEITITKMPNASASHSRAIKLLRAYGFNEGTYILTSPWILQLREVGVLLTVNEGAWGKRFDFEFSPEMVDSKAYQIWTGCQIHLADELIYKMRCDLAYANTIMDTSPQGHLMRYNEETQTLIMRQPKEHHWIMPHIGSFIIGYCQLNIFKESLKYDPKDIVGTKLDSILLATEPHDISPLFVDLKTDPEWDGVIKMNPYTSPHIYEPASADLSHADPPFVLGDAFVSGPGGGGKTHTILSTKSFQKTLYVTRAWKLIADKVREFPHVYGTSVNQLLGFDYQKKPTQSYKDKFGSPAVIVIDEPSMWSLDEIARVFAMYPYSQILIAGDYDKGHYYQSSVNMPSELYHPENPITLPDGTVLPPIQFIMLSEDRRSKDELTRAFKRVIRDYVDRNNLSELRAFMLSRFPVEPIEAITYDMDYILTGTNERMKFFTHRLLNEDPTKNHYLVMRHSMTDVFNKIKGEEGFLHGELVRHDQAEGRTEPRHAFTVHSFQGITIEEPKKCFIDIMDLAYPQDIYTAISRVQNINQIHLIH